MLSPASFPYSASPLFFYVTRAGSHFFVLLSLIALQFFAWPFSGTHFSALFALCFLIFLGDSFCLFFYRGASARLELPLLLASALFLSAVTAIMGLPGLLFAFIAAFAQSFPLFLSGRVFQPLSLFLGLSLSLPLAFFWWEERLSFPDRLFLTVFSHLALGFIFCLGWLSLWALKFSEGRKADQESLLEEDFLRPSPHIGLALDLLRKFKPVLNSLRKYFSEGGEAKESLRSVPSSVFSPKKGREQLEQMRKFVLDFIEYAEPEIDFLLEDIVDLRELVERLLAKLELSSKRPENLAQNAEFPEKFKIRGSASHLTKCFESILLNSFEAFGGQENPEIHIQGWRESGRAVLEFSDNGQGIEPEDMKRLFDPLFSKRLFGLRGLGLPCAQKIVRAHGGSLEIKSSPEGTSVTVSFPLIYDFYDSSAKLRRAKAA